MMNHPDVLQVHGVRYRPLTQYLSNGVYHCAKVCVLDTFYGQILQYIYRFWEALMPEIGAFEAQRLQMKQGEVYPRRSLMTVMFWFYWVAERIGTRVSY